MEKMMKKLMFALIAAVLCSNLMAGVLIYDYSASFKRIEVTSPTKVKVGKTTYKIDTAKVVSDKFTGYVVIDACDECGGEMVYSAERGETNPGNFAVVYIKRAGSKKLTGNRKNALYRAIGRFYAAKFGPKSGLDVNGHAVNKESFTEACGFLSYKINADGDGMASSKDKYYGYLGFGQVGSVGGDITFGWWEDGDATLSGGIYGPYAILCEKGGLATTHHADDGYHNVLVHPFIDDEDFDTVDHAGFGKVVKNKVAEECEEDSYCWMVKSLSGSLTAGYVYTGYCGDFLFDICDGDYHDGAWLNVTSAAPIAGTFTMKLNNKKSFNKDSFRYSDFAEADADIVDGNVCFHDPYETLLFEAWHWVVFGTMFDAEANKKVQAWDPALLVGDHWDYTNLKTLQKNVEKNLDIFVIPPSL